MVWTNAQTTSFFTDATQMALPPRSYAQLATEGITVVDDLAEFNDEDFKQMVYNLAHPPATVVPADPAAVPPVLAHTIPTDPYILGAKSLRRLKIAAKAIRYYQSVQRATDSSNMHYVRVLSKFELQWEAIIAKGKEDEPDVPKVTKNLAITRWSESFNDFMNQVYGSRDTPLSYVIRPSVDVPVPAPDLLNNQPHSAQHGSVEGELIARLSHTHPVFRDDNKAVYLHLEVATRGTVYSASITPFCRTKDGRSAYMALISQHAGVDKWERELKSNENFLKTRFWKGNSNFSLEKFIEQHRAAYISLQRCAEHITYQLPNENTRVRYLMDAIQSSDAELQAGLAAVRTDNVGPTSKRNNFEAAVTCLLPCDPVARRRKSTNDRANANIASVSTSTSESKVKPSMGKTGVELRYYKRAEYQSLSDEQKLELKEWRANSKNSGRKRDAEGGDAGYTAKRRKEIMSVFREERKKEADRDAKRAEADAKQLNELRNVISSVTITPKTSASVASASAPDATEKFATQLQGILKRGGKSGSSSS